MKMTPEYDFQPVSTPAVRSRPLITIRETMNATYQILYWRDIPAQVKVRLGRQRVNRALSERFQEAIDEAAMRARTTSTDDYLDEWRSSEQQEGEGDPEQLADRVAAELEAEYTAERLAYLVEKKGLVIGDK
jgi:hypothetical protein